MQFFLERYVGLAPGAKPTIASTFEEALKLTGKQMFDIIVKFSIGYLVLGVVLIIMGMVVGRSTKKEHPESKEHIEQDNLLPPEEDTKKLTGGIEPKPVVKQEQPEIQKAEEKPTPSEKKTISVK
jgi:hypothetical protein